MTTAEAAAALNVQDSRIRQMLIAGQINGVKHAGVWLVYAPGGVPERKPRAAGNRVLERQVPDGWEPVAIRGIKLSRAQNRALMGGETIETEGGIFRRVDWQERRERNLSIGLDRFSEGAVV